MSTRQSKRNLVPEFDILEEQHGKRDVGTNTDEPLKECFEKESIEMVQSPVFNIHIHVPASGGSSSTEMYLPRIQPIIHLHFDELSKQLGNIAAQQNGGLSEMHLQNLISKVTPKFGKVLFHHEDNSFKRDDTNNIINTSPRKQMLRDKSPSFDLESSGNVVTEIMRNHTLEFNDQSSKSSHEEKSNESNDEEVSDHKLSNNPPIKLKKAVVVLNDICKSKFYNGAVVSGLAEHEKTKIANNSSSSILREFLSFGAVIKKECTSDSPGSSEETNECGDTLFKNPFSSKCSASLHCDSMQKRSLESLIEGCNFSEFLRRFKRKSQKCSDDASEASNFLVKSENMVEGDEELEDKNVSLTRNNAQPLNQTFCDHHPHDEGEEQNKDGVNLQENHIGGVESYETKIQLPPNNKNLIRSDIEARELNNSNGCKVEGFIEKVGLIMKDNVIVHSINEIHVTDDKSDKSEITTKNKLSSEIAEDLKNVEFASFNETSNVFIKNVSDVLATNELSLVDIEDQNFDFKLMDKESTMTKQGVDKTEKNEKRKLRDAYELRSRSRNESPPKKIKQSHETPKKPAKESSLKSSGSEDYMTLNVSGPTKFSVAPLQSIPAFKAHDARNFKNNTLFGNRVNRFSSPDQLQVYKLKKQAAGRRL